MKIRLLLLLLTVVMLQSCMYQQAESVVNKDIDQSLRNTIKAKNDSLFYALSHSSNKILLKLGTEDFGKFMHSRLDKVIWAFSGKALGTDYTVFDEYYNTHSTVPDNSVITNEDHGYTFTFQNNEKETYVSMLKFTKDGIDDYLITVIYNREGNDWKLEQIEVGQLGIYGKTAHDLFNEGKKYKQNNFPLDAFFHLNAANSFLHPAGKMLVYDQETKIGLYTPIWTNEATRLYTFPRVLDKIKTQPVIHGISCVKNPEGFYPLISYITQIPVNDTVALKREFEQVKQEARKTYTAMDFKKPFMYYRAYNLYPNSQELGDNYTFRDKR